LEQESRFARVFSSIKYHGGIQIQLGKPSQIIFDKAVNIGDLKLTSRLIDYGLGVISTEL